MTFRAEGVMLRVIRWVSARARVGLYLPWRCSSNKWVVSLRLPRIGIAATLIAVLFVLAPPRLLIFWAFPARPRGLNASRAVPRGAARLKNRPLVCKSVFGQAHDRYGRFLEVC
jgi:cytochrome c oxidase assembly factor CtaG